ncbi:MAG: siroheme decarboxylase subunit beta [Bilophila sp.]
MSIEFTDTERAILRIVQDQLPDSATPYADIAREVGTDEGTVLALLRRLRDDGAIRRFGASIKHQKTGWAFNAMVGWKIDDSLIDAAGEHAARHPHISHCYHRPTTTPDWPYTLYTMIHGRSADDCQNVIDTLRRETALEEYAILESLEELKKTSMNYF